VPIAPRWQRRVLLAAGWYNLAWGAWVVLRPGDLFRWTGAPQPTYPELWQCIGMFVLVWGIGYLVAASDPWRHWPIVLVGLLGKLLGPIGLVGAAADGRFPWSWGWTIVTNDLVWIIPFAVILAGATRAHAGGDLRMRLARVQRRLGVDTDAAACELAEPSDRVLPGSASDRAVLLARTRTQADGRVPPDLLVVFLRHSGCIFCREALDELACRRAAIEADGTRIVLVHLDDDPERLASIVARHGLDGVELVPDPERRLYRAFELRSAPVRAHFTWRQWLAGIRAWLSTAQFLGAPRGDALQLPGVVRISKGRVVQSVLADRSGMRIDLRTFIP
jgi:hypothetical protein